MQPFKENYLKVEEWYLSQDAKKIKQILESEWSYDKTTDLEKLRATVNWYLDISKQPENIKQYLFGEVILTLKDISSFMIKYLESRNYGPEEGEDEDEWTEDERDSGYGGYSCYLDIVSFWEDLDDSAVLAVLEGNVIDGYEIDLDNGRCYFLSRSNVHPLIFAYVYYNQESFLKSIGAANSNDFSDDLEDFLPPKELFLPNISTFNMIYNNMINKKFRKEIERYDSLLSNVVKQFTNHEIEDLRNRAKELEKYLINEKGA